jgi:hypothetical protein
MHFPVEGTVSYRDDFGEPRDGHTHQGNDLMGAKLQRELAAADSVVTYWKHEAAGNMLILTDAEGWTYWYIHINNDTPGTDDGANPIEWAFAPGVVLGARVFAGQFIAYMGDSGNAESTAPHLHFELHPPNSNAIDPYFSLQAGRTEPGPDDIVLGGTIYPKSVPYWSLRNSVTTGTADTAYVYGDPGDTPVACDWNGDGVTSAGIRRGNTYYLRNDNSPGVAQKSFTYGTVADVPLCGDWNGDGIDTIGVYRGGGFFLKNKNKTGSADIAVRYGADGDIPIVGDWDGDGTDTIGVVRGGVFMLRNSNTPGIADVNVPYGDLSDRPIVGDWDGDGIDTVGVARSGTFYLRNTNTPGFANISFAYGTSGDTPIAGDWNNNATDTIGVVSWS